jgi:hypothetical protein
VHPFEELRVPVHPAFPVRLIDGYREFLAERMPTEQERYREFAKRGQSPAIMIIGCCVGWRAARSSAA